MAYLRSGRRGRRRQEALAHLFAGRLIDQIAGQHLDQRAPALRACADLDQRPQVVQTGGTDTERRRLMELRGRRYVEDTLKRSTLLSKFARLLVTT